MPSRNSEQHVRGAVLDAYRQQEEEEWKMKEVEGSLRQKTTALMHNIRAK